MAFMLCGRRLVKYKKIFREFQRHNGFIVLVPEIGEEASGKNPLLQHDGLPEFSDLTVENCMAAIAKQTLDFEAGIKNIENNLSTTQSQDVFKDIIEPVEQLGNPLETTWGLSKTLYLSNSTLMPTKTYLAIHDRARRARVVKFNNKTIYDSMKAKLEDSKNCTDEEKRILRKFTLEGKLNGLDLDQSGKGQLIEQLNKLATQRGYFKQKVDLSTKQFSHLINDNTIVRDFPPELLKLSAANPNNYLQGPWKITLEPTVYSLTLENCPQREIRWNLWQANVSRGSGYGERDLATGIHIEEIRYVRRDIAKVLGYETFADMSMETKMAGSVENVHNLLKLLLERAKPAQDLELEVLYKFALERGFKGSRIELWDVPFWKRKQQKTLFDYNDDELRKYFPLPKVLNGLFELCEKLFNIKIETRSGKVSTWHKDVKYYDIFENNNPLPIAGFYIDPYARTDDKIQLYQNNGWMVGIQNQSHITESKALAALIFNFEPPTQSQPSYLNFREVKALFHKFGLALQHLLTRTNYAEVSGFSNNEWDTVEVSGYVLSHWLHNKNVIDSITSHSESGDVLPNEIFENLQQVHQHLAGTELCRQLYLSALDLELHYSKDYWLDIVKRVWPDYISFPLVKVDSHPCSFTQIFSEEWGAAYYSHIWSRMIAADIYSAFHEVQSDEEKVLDVGKRYRETFLALGGSSHPSKTFRKFRGRDPSPKALLKSLGLKKINKNDKK